MEKYEDNMEEYVKNTKEYRLWDLEQIRTLPSKSGASRLIWLSPYCVSSQNFPSFHHCHTTFPSTNSLIHSVSSYLIPALSSPSLSSLFLSLSLPLILLPSLTTFLQPSPLSFSLHHSILTCFMSFLNLNPALSS